MENKDETKIDPIEYLKYLKLAYIKERFPKPRTIFGEAQRTSRF